MEEQEAQRSSLGSARAQSGMHAADSIVIRGASEHNLKSIDVLIPRNKLVVITGVSGSGKSSLAFDTVYAEAERRFFESLSPFIRHFMEKIERPKVDYISGLTPALAIEQKAVSNNPRSTVGTLTEVYHYLRLLYSRIGLRHCLQCGSPIQPQTSRSVALHVLRSLPPSERFLLLAPVVRGLEGDHVALLEEARRDGHMLARIDGALRDLKHPPTLSRTERHTIDLVLGEMRTPKAGDDEVGDFIEQLAAAMRDAFRIGKGVALAAVPGGHDLAFTSCLICPQCGATFPDLTSQHFSFNSPSGMCRDCGGLGVKPQVDPDLLIHDARLSILDGALQWFGNLRENKRTTWPLGPLDVIAEHYGVDLNTLWQDLPERFRNVILYGSGGEKIRFPPQTGLEDWVRPVKGLVPEISRLFRETSSESMRRKYSAFMRLRPCPSCAGSRLNIEARAVTLHGQTIADVGDLPIDRALSWVNALYVGLDSEQIEIARDILAEVRDRLSFLTDVGLHYLTLNRSAPSLSGGEGQRVRLATQLGSGLTGVLYILDEPSVGLHVRDQHRLVNTLCALRDMGSSIVVVEHDADTMRAADWLIDMGPGAGALGGEVVAAGPVEVIAASLRSLTGQYLAGRLSVTAPNAGNRRRPTNGWLEVHGARLHNLKNVNARFPLGLVTCVTGVSGSGKSSLVAETLEPALSRGLGKGSASPGPYDRIEGADSLERVISITQDPIGRTPRSNPATYTKVFDEIRKVFASTQEAKKRGYRSAHFSFNAGGGRCESCRGHGRRKIEMHFLPDVWVTCQDCNGSRYTAETLRIRYKGKNIADVLDMSVDEALGLFSDRVNIVRVLQTLCDVGLGYIRLGQSATTLSGGEAQRVKLARELGGLSTGHTLYVLDEPTTGLHFADIQHLVNVLHWLVDAGNTVVVVEHNLDVIKTADWIIDMGPEGGESGGTIVAEGPPEEIASEEASYTGQALRRVLDVISPPRGQGTSDTVLRS